MCPYIHRCEVNEMSGFGNPYFMEGLKERRARLKTKLKESKKEDWDKVLARFAIDENLTETTVESYFLLLKKAGMLDE